MRKNIILIAFIAIFFFLNIPNTQAYENEKATDSLVSPLAANTPTPTIMTIYAPVATATPTPKVKKKKTKVKTTATPTVNPTITITPTVTAAPSMTITPTITITPTAMIKPSATITPTSTITPTLKVQPTVTITPTATITPTVTITPTAPMSTATPIASTETPTPTTTPVDILNIPSDPTCITNLTPSPTTPQPIPVPSPHSGEEQPADKRSWVKFPYSQLIAQAAKKYNVDPQVIYATIMTESEGDVYAYRYEPRLREASLCMGQILVSTARSLGFTGPNSDLYKPEVCIDLIGKYHRNMLDTFGPLTPLQLATAYNAGSPWKRAVWGHLARFQMWLEETT